MLEPTSWLGRRLASSVSSSRIRTSTAAYGTAFRKEPGMTLDRKVRMIAGTFVLVSVALGWWVSPYWFLFTAFVGANLFQSSLTKTGIHREGGS
jgi:hypothetical protein